MPQPMENIEKTKPGSSIKITITDLPNEMLEKCFSYLTYKNIGDLRYVSYINIYFNDECNLICLNRSISDLILWLRIY